MLNCACWVVVDRAFCCTSLCLSVSALKQEAQLPHKDLARTLGHLKSCQLGLLLNCTKMPLKIAVGEWPSRTFKVDWYWRQSIARPHFTSGLVDSGHVIAVIVMKFGMVTHIGPYSGLTVKISNFWKFKMAAAAILKITKIAIFPQRFDRSSRNLVRWC